MINSLISSLIQLRVSDLHIVASKAPPPVHRLPSFQFLFQTRFSFQAHIFLQIAIVQNMKIPADEHVTALNSATGKKRLFHIGMNTVYSTKFRSNYVLKKSFKIDNEKYNPIDTPTNTINPSHFKPSACYLFLLVEGVHACGIGEDFIPPSILRF
ncbi:uncharacterized protein [Miscanthus floridulus]|uniref:uncharacterized protein isoform X5 n=1 Tax=Miscanthus floridulus TaxID=154761 RepID=UPI00345766A5